jgi:hypothetical protein
METCAALIFGVPFSVEDTQKIIFKSNQNTVVKLIDYFM